MIYISAVLQKKDAIWEFQIVLRLIFLNHVLTLIIWNNL